MRHFFNKFLKNATVRLNIYRPCQRRKKTVWKINYITRFNVTNENKMTHGHVYAQDFVNALTTVLTYLGFG